MNRGMVAFGLAAALTLAGCSSSEVEVAPTTTHPQASTTAALSTAIPVPTQSPPATNGERRATTTSQPVATVPPPLTTEVAATPESRVSINTNVIGTPATKDARSVIQAAFGAAEAFAQAAKNPTIENEQGLAEYFVDPQLGSARDQIRSYREAGRFTEVNDVHPSSMTVLADTVQLGEDSASVSLCFVDSAVLVEQTPEGRKVVNDEVATNGRRYWLQRVDDRWLLAKVETDEAGLSACDGT